MGGTSFDDNAVEQDRRKLQALNLELTNKNAAMTNIMKSKTNERAKFMEGASWIATKSQ